MTKNHQIGVAGVDVKCGHCIGLGNSPFAADASLTGGALEFLFERLGTLFGGSLLGIDHFNGHRNFRERRHRQRWLNIKPAEMRTIQPRKVNSQL